jgi:sodium/potassium/calcium exchanger 6
MANHRRQRVLLLGCVVALGVLLMAGRVSLRRYFTIPGDKIHLRHTAPPLLFAQARCDITDNPSRCARLAHTSTCTTAHINYPYWCYCTGLPVPLALCVFALWIVLLFYWLAVAADEYLVPALQNIAQGLRIPPDVAGLTFMALGNGAPDVFGNNNDDRVIVFVVLIFLECAGTFAAVSNNSYGLSVGELLGSGIYVTTVVVGLVSFVSVAKVQPAAFVRYFLYISCLFPHFNDLMVPDP